MGKYFVAVITVLTICVFIAGCSSTSPASPVQSETAEAEMEPNKPTIVEPQPVAAAESSIELYPPEAEPSIEPNEVKPTEAEPNIPAPIKHEPNDVQPPETEPNEVKSIKAEPNEVQPAKIEPNEVMLDTRYRILDTRRESRIENRATSPQPTVSFHEKCADILKNYVDDRGMVNYKALRYKRLELKKLLDEFANLDPNEYSRWPKEDKIAFWINAYNIQMLKVIIDNYPIQGSRWLNPFYGPNSIRHIKGIWSDYKFIVMDEEFTLAEVDRRFFSKKFDEPRIFSAISLASISSPPLRNEPYYGNKINQQLEDQTKKFLSNPLSFRIDRESKKVYLSAILQPSWRGKEFISKFAIDRKFKDQEPEIRAVLNFITGYLPRRDVDFLEVENYSIKFLRYDWTINDGS